MRESPDAVLGLRGPGGTSGVGLFNTILASRLHVPYLLLDDALGADGGSGAHQGIEDRVDEQDVSPRPLLRPLLSLKFEELSPEQEPLVRCRFVEPRDVALSLFLHTLADTPLERDACRAARLVYCGNDAIAARLSERLPLERIRRAFAPSLIPDTYREACRPGGVEFFYFGMAGKIDRPRFLSLRARLEALGVEYKLLCSLAIHQTSDGSCLPSALEFFGAHFPRQFIFLGNLTEMGVSYFLNTRAIFLGFYREGLRGNNTTFNTALRHDRRIITNLDAYSPPEVRSIPTVLDIDTASDDALMAFLCSDAAPEGAARSSSLFGWDHLIQIVRGEGVDSRKALKAAARAL